MQFPNVTQTLLSENTKISKGIKTKNIRTFGIHLAPAGLSGYQVCAHASKGCEESCLNTSGRGAQSNVQIARIKKTKALFEHKAEFMAKLFKEVSTKIKTSKRTGVQVSFRFNLTSDVMWEKIKHNGKNLFETFPDVQFYDYTKNYNRAMDFVNKRLPENYHITFSRSEENVSLCEAALKFGANVAYVFMSKRGDKLPETYKGYKVIDGDADDLRFLDDANCIVGLRSKGKANKDETGFAIQL